MWLLVTQSVPVEESMPLLGYNTKLVQYLTCLTALLSSYAAQHSGVLDTYDTLGMSNITSRPGCQTPLFWLQGTENMTARSLYLILIATPMVFSLL